MRICLIFALLSLAAPAVAHEGMIPGGCDPGATFTVGDLTISGAFSRAMLPKAPSAGGYFTVTNAGAVADTLVAVKSEAAAVVQIHQMTMEGDVMKMGEVAGGIEVPAGGSVTLEPSGLHLMFMGIKTPFAEGVCVAVTLSFARAGEVPVVLSIGGVSAEGPEHMH